MVGKIRSARATVSGIDSLDSAMAAFPEEPFYRTTIVKDTTLRFGLEPLDLGKTTIDKQFRSRDVATVVGRKKRYGLRDLFWFA